MAAEGLWGPGGPPGWELDGWYEDLQEVLAAEPPGPAPAWGPEQVEPGPGGCGLDLALAEELLQLLEPEGAAPAEPPAATPGGSGPGPAEEAEEEEEKARGARRKRRGGAGAPRQRDGERRVRELTAHNERLRAEIQRLSSEVQRTRAALIDRIVNLRQV
ncbi:DNA damage-inducible transcript 3 protein [Pyrgilauda ruficollis]|uniref:DNA damage-inducible transcript 3 protein n=1 Tax=Pyrgilauda ruficollis TaxID=221976 RepID=UPI001B86DCC1|nr:DNA damage-inducible transcript 3 protein [Pyrgilauda ruficollis]